MLNELYTSELFERYQVKLIADMNRLIVSLMNKKEYAQMAGAIEMARTVIAHPSRNNKSEAVATKSAENMKRFQSNFIRGELDD